MLGSPSIALGLMLMVEAPADVPAAPASALAWHAAPSCPQPEQGRALIERFLGGPLPAATAVDVQLRPAGAGYTAWIDVDGAARQLTASDCPTLARAAALVVAVSIDAVEVAEVVLPDAPPNAPNVEPLPDPGPSDPLYDPPPEAPDAEPERARTPPRARRTGAGTGADARPPPEPAPRAQHWMGIGGGIAADRLPAVTGSLRLGSALVHGHFRFQADLHYTPPRRLDYPDESGVGARIQSVAIGGRVCFVPGGARWSVPLCAGAEGGPLIGQGFGADRERTAVTAWVAGLVSAAGSLRLHPRVALTAGIDALPAIRRPAFHVGDRPALLRSPTVGVRGGLGVEFRLK